MRASKPVRLAEFRKRLLAEAPFSSWEQAFERLSAIIKEVEDQMSGIPFDPDAAFKPTDGRMYAPHIRFKRESECATVRKFAQTGHRTFIGDNGAILIVGADKSIFLDSPGLDGRTVADLIAEAQNDPL